MVHVVFQQADTGLLKAAMELDESLKGDILEIKDEWGVGPLQGIDTEEGWNARVNWWRELLKETPYGEKLAGSFDDRKTVEDLKSLLDKDSTLEAWIWAGQNQHDVIGYYWLITQLKPYVGRIMIIYLNNLPFINEKGQLFYPWNIHDILPKEAVKAKRLARSVTLSEFELDPDEWKKIMDENAMVRILEGGKKITGQSPAFYDAEIMKNITAEWQKASRVMHNILHRMKIKTGDVYLMWRIRNLINEGRIEILGEPTKGWKEFDLRQPQNKESGEMNESAEINTAH